MEFQIKGTFQEPFDRLQQNPLFKLMFFIFNFNYFEIMESIKLAIDIDSLNSIKYHFNLETFIFVVQLN
jgi:hypothetical protein